MEGAKQKIGGASFQFVIEIQPPTLCNKDKGICLKKIYVYNWLYFGCKAHNSYLVLWACRSMHVTTPVTDALPRSLRVCSPSSLLSLTGISSLCNIHKGGTKPPWYHTTLITPRATTPIFQQSYVTYLPREDPEKVMMCDETGRGS